MRNLHPTPYAEGMQRGARDERESPRSNIFLRKTALLRKKYYVMA